MSTPVRLALTAVLAVSMAAGSVFIASTPASTAEECYFVATDPPLPPGSVVVCKPTTTTTIP